MLDLLSASGVQTVLDVRAVPLSRKAGFSKNGLAASLAERGIAYVLDRRLSTPKAGRDAVRKGRTGDMHLIFSEHLALPDAQIGLSEAVMLARAQAICLLCFERAPHDCHRSIVAACIHEQTGQPIRHL